MKKILSVILSLVMVLSLSATAFAADAEPTAEGDYGSVVSSGVFMLTPQSRETYYGNSGFSTLDYLSEGYLQWSIHVDDKTIVSFEGNLSFNKLGTPFGTFNHSISTTDSSGTEDVRYGLSKGDWEVKFTGSATDTTGSKYFVTSIATLKFYVYQNW